MAGVLRSASTVGAARRKSNYGPRDVQDIKWSRHPPADVSAAVLEGGPWRQLRPRPQGKLLSRVLLHRDARPRCPVALRVLVHMHGCLMLGAAAAPLLPCRLSQAMLLLVWLHRSGAA